MKLYRNRFFPSGRRRALPLFLALTALMLIPINLMYNTLVPILAAAAENRTRAVIIGAVNDCIRASDFSELLLLYSGEDGTITGASADTGKLNEVKSAFALDVTEALEETAVRVPVPCGDIMGAPLTLGRGPSLIVRVTGYSAAVTDIKSEFLSAGLNQSLYRLTMTVSVSCTIILPRFESAEVSVTTTVPLAETVIVGEVPGYYRN